MNVVDSTSDPRCRRCGFLDPDLQLIGCSCLLHVMCTPLSLVMEGSSPYQCEVIPAPVVSTSRMCPICRLGFVKGIRLHPMAFGELEQAVELRKQAAQVAARSATTTSGAASGKRSRDDHDADDALYHQIQAESSYLMLSRSASVGSNRDHCDRTGRWSTEEVAYVDLLVAGFDQGALPLPHGVKLNDFLGEVLMCKSSRLTKKMKNAKLSTRSFALKNIVQGLSDEQCVSLSALQGKFLQSVPSDPLQLELKFNMTKLWRTHFSNLCIQVGYQLLDAREWVSSLDEMERRASEAEEHIRQARRRRMGMALRQDVGPTSKRGVFIGGYAANRGNLALPPVTLSSELTSSNVTAPVAKPSPVKPETGSYDAVHFLNDQYVTSGQEPKRSHHHKSFSDDYSIDMLEELLAPSGDRCFTASNKFSDCDPFLENIIFYMEAENVPFEHVDVWVPSFLDNAKAETMRLFHAGHATRSDIDSTICTKFIEYGAYSTNFSFAPGVGLPGRVYTSGQPTWECNIDCADPTRFERAGGAQVYGVKTAIGIPLEAPVVGRIVLALYSSADIPEDQVALQRYANAFSKWTPEPKWKVEIELGAVGQEASAESSSTGVRGQGHSNNLLRNERDVPSAFSTVTPHNAEATRLGSTTNQVVAAAPPSSDHDIEQRIASILGDHMPDQDANSTLHHFICLRLLLLRSHDRRSSKDNELLDIIKKSYLAYSNDNRRSNAELASLLVRDWMFLSPSPVTTTKNTITMQHIAHNRSAAPSTISGQSVQFLGVPNTAATTMSNVNTSNHVHWQHIASSARDEFNNSAATDVDVTAAATSSRNGGFPPATLVPKSPRD